MRSATYFTKLAGYAVPARWLQNPRMACVAGAIVVVLTSLWPSSSCTVRMSVPDCSRCVANECLLCRHRHRRHSLATELLRSNATLSEIGHLLRHKSHDTTRIYAKVDIETLRTLSLPWPGGAQ